MKVFIVAAKRTPFGSFGGSLKNISANELGGIAAKAALNQVPKLKIDHVVFGNVAQTSTDACYLARHVSHRAGVNLEVPALTINRLCGSGFEAAIQGAMSIRLKEAHAVLVGGTENMSMSPYAIRNVRFGIKYGTDLKGEDTLSSALVDRYPNVVSMGTTAEILAKENNISRAQCDEYALFSQQRWFNAEKEGRFQKELCEMDLLKDEHPRQTNLESLKKLRPVFQENGVVTAGNASGISDGAAALVLASEEAVKKHQLDVLAEIIGYQQVGVDPQRMGIGPVPAILKLLKRLDLKLEQMSLLEVNEAFAAQYLSVEKQLKLDRTKTNTNGGAIAIGHPLAASGARILTHLSYELQRTRGKYALGAACIGGGQGIAVLLRN